METSSSTLLNRSISLQTLYSTKEKEFGSLNNFSKYLNFEKYGSCESLPPPKHCSTPKSKISNNDNIMIFRKFEKKTKEKSLSLEENRSPTSVWMDELRSNYASECMTTLQSKSLFSDMGTKIKMLADLTTKVVKILHYETYLIAKEFDHIYRCMENNFGTGVYALIESLVYHMIDVLDEHSNYGDNLDAYYQVLEMIDPISLERVPLAELIWKINALALDFSKKIDILLLNQIKIMVGILESVQNYKSVLLILNSLSAVGLQPDHLGNLLARCGGVTVLLQLFQNCYNDSISTCILKLLATVCCTPSAIKVFKQNHGLEILCDTLSVSDIEPDKLKEGVLLLLHVTGPWLKYNIIPLEKYIAPLVSALTGIVRKTSEYELVLIAAAGLANLSHEELSLKSIVNQGSVILLLNTLRAQGAEASIFLKEQTTTIILNLSSKPEYCLYLCENRVIPALLCFLKLELTSITSTLIEATTYRVQYKAALTLSRLCNEKEAIRQIQELQGVSRIIKLHKDGIEKHRRDGIVAATSDTLKKIMTATKIEALNNGKRIPVYSKMFVPTR